MAREHCSVCLGTASIHTLVARPMREKDRPVRTRAHAIATARPRVAELPSRAQRFAVRYTKRNDKPAA
jgi:hypothetical protein